MLRAIEATLMETRPQRVLTFGDTNSTLAATLAAAKLHIPVAHVEAGLRSRNMRMPEEVNRIVSDRLSDILFTPSEDADANLLAEGVAPDRIHRVGDVMFDAARRFAPATMLRRQHILVTIHRPENTESDARMRAICDALDALAAEHRVVFPIHPRTRQAFARLGIAPSSSVQAIDPVGYKDMAKLQAESIVVVTDSGGVQKEAFFHGVPCVTVRDETEWVELLRTGWNRLAPPISAATIIDAVRSAAHGAPATRPILYGDGQAAERIATVLARAADVTPR
jgi:UDP-GlcNAc3NAcA epimerase